MKTSAVATTEYNADAALARVLIGRPSIRFCDPHPLVLRTTAMDESWIARFDAAEASRRATDPIMQNKREKLAASLIAFGGQRACIATYEEDLDLILDRGRLFSGQGLKMTRGAPCSCHANVSRLSDANPGAFLVATGYALSSDGMWRQHSWGFSLAKRVAPLVETTAPRLAYFGYVLSTSEADAFAYQNF